MIILKERLWLYSKKIAKQILFKKFDCDDEIYISVKYILLFLWNIFHFCEIYLINCKKKMRWE